MGIRYKIKRAKVNARNKLKRKLNLDEVQEIAYSVTIALMSDSDSELLIEPNSNKKFITNEALDSYVIFDKGMINVVNGVYHYDLYIDDKIYTDIAGRFNKKIRQKRNILEGQIRSRIKKNLNKTLSDIKGTTPEEETVTEKTPAYQLLKNQEQADS